MNSLNWIRVNESNKAQEFKKVQQGDGGAVQGSLKTSTKETQHPKRASSNPKLLNTPTLLRHQAAKLPGNSMCLGRQRGRSRVEHEAVNAGCYKSKREKVSVLKWGLLGFRPDIFPTWVASHTLQWSGSLHQDFPRSPILCGLMEETEEYLHRAWMDFIADTAN